ncbi:MAG TPA: DUF302 domain-containing protein [Niastella sp.]
MKQAIVVEHVVIEVQSNFNDFTFQLETALGIMTPASFCADGIVPASMACYLAGTTEDNELILFNILLPNDLRKEESGPKIKQYQVCNPRVMSRMIAQNAGAALYTPLHLLVYEKPNGKVVVEYDLPSSFFTRFNNAAINIDAARLESKLVKLIKKADAVNGSSQM